MLVHHLYARLSAESRQDLADITAAAPVTLEFGDLEILSSHSPIEAVEIEGSMSAVTLGLTTQYDEHTQSSPLILLLNSPELDSAHQALSDQGHSSAWPYAYVPYMRMSVGSIPRRRHITSFINSISDTLNRNPLTLTFDTFFFDAGNYDVPPFINYFMSYRGYMV